MYIASLFLLFIISLNSLFPLNSPSLRFTSMTPIVKCSLFSERTELLAPRLRCPFYFIAVRTSHQPPQISNLLFSLSFCSADHQKLEREARICRLLKHHNIGEFDLHYDLPLISVTLKPPKWEYMRIFEVWDHIWVKNVKAIFSLSFKILSLCLGCSSYSNHSLNKRYKVHH